MEPSTVRSLVLAYLFVALLALVFVIGFIAPASAFPINGGYICLDTTPRCLVCDFDCGMATAKSSCDSFGFASDAAQVVADASLYDWCVSSPPLIINGACGSANGSSQSSTPTVNLCSAGTPTTVSNNVTTYTWTCQGMGGGTNSSTCTAYKPGCDKGCNGSVTYNPCKSTACEIDDFTCPNGTRLFITGTSTWSGASCSGHLINWQGVLASYCVTDSACSAPVVNGTCSTTAGACTAGSVSNDNGATACGTTRTWKCAGSNGGSTANCSKANAACSGGCYPDFEVYFGWSCPGPTESIYVACPAGQGAPQAAYGSHSAPAVCNQMPSESVWRASECRVCGSPPVNGACSSTAGACTAGTASGDNNASACGTTRTWTCNGSGGGSNASCSKANAACPTPVNGVCGSANGQDLTAAPSGGDLCNAGSASTVSGTGPWSWTCAGANGGSNASCSATLCGGPPAVDAACGPAAGQYFSTASAVNSTGLCNPGTSPNVSGSGPWNWTCTGENGGANVSCSAAAATTVNGACKAYGSTYASQPASNTSTGCNAGTFAEYSDTGSAWRWQCTGGGAPTGSTATCSASKVAAVNGACGPANGTTVSSAPTANLCSTGSASAVTGSGPWNWTCAGSGGGSNASCSASNATTCMINGVETPIPDGQTTCPTTSCFFSVTGGATSGWLNPSDTAYFRKASQSDFAGLIGGLVGPGSYSPASPYSGYSGTGDFRDCMTPNEFVPFMCFITEDPAYPFKGADARTFDEMVVGPTTRVKIYKTIGYTGGLYVDVHGPAVIMNAIWRGDQYGDTTPIHNDSRWASEGYGGKVYWSDSPAIGATEINMQKWGRDSSVQVTCD